MQITNRLDFGKLLQNWDIQETALKLEFKEVIFSAVIRNTWKNAYDSFNR